MACSKQPTSFHTLQNKNSKYVQQVFSKTNRLLLHETAPETVYESSKGKKIEKTTVHYGRRQLLINEIEFLTICFSSLNEEYGLDVLKTKKVVVFYAGAAVGLHLLLLAEFFPFVHKFVCVDKEKFALVYGKKTLIQRFELIDRFFDEKLAQEYLEKYNDNEDFVRLFISDIRSTEQDEVLIEADMDLQANIHKILKPFKSYLKFRLPYYDKKRGNLVKSYLDGDIYFLIWGGSHTSETRLLVHKNSDEKNYDNAKYENQLYHFNKYERTLCYEHSIDADGFDHCYDCRAEIYVFEEYSKIFDILKSLTIEINSKKSIQQYIKDVNNDLSANTKNIEYSLVLDNSFKSSWYPFTAFKFGSIKDDFDLRKFCLNETKELLKKTSNRKKDFDITKAIKGLKLN